MLYTQITASACYGVLSRCLSLKTLIIHFPHSNSIRPNLHLSEQSSVPINLSNLQDLTLLWGKLTDSIPMFCMILLDLPNLHALKLDRRCAVRYAGFTWVTPAHIDFFMSISFTLRRFTIRDDWEGPMYDSDQNIHIEGLLACLPYVQFVNLLPAFPLSSSTLEMIRTGTFLPTLASLHLIQILWLKCLHYDTAHNSPCVGSGSQPMSPLEAVKIRCPSGSVIPQDALSNFWSQGLNIATYTWWLQVSSVTTILFINIRIALGEKLSVYRAPKDTVNRYVHRRFAFQYLALNSNSFRLQQRTHIEVIIYNHISCITSQISVM